MQIDFHYCTIRVLAEKAGFSPEDAQIIAYASQHVDDAVDHEKMNVDGHLDILSHRFVENTFDPICTAHKGLQFLKGFKEEVHHKIYIPFHFLPDLESSESFVVPKNCGLSRKLVQQTLTELGKSSGEHRILNLIRLGIALHTFSDSWAHQNFSGIHNSKDNDVKSIELFKDGKWEKIPVLLKLEYDVLPDIGHAEAGSYPDLSHLKWRFIKDSTHQIEERDNSLIFLEAAENIVSILSGLHSSDDWPTVKSKLQECYAFVGTTEEKFKKFQRTFPEIGFYYDEQQWRNEAILMVESSKLISVVKEVRSRYVLGSDKKWFFFHLAAFEQRNFVESLIKKRIG